MAGPSTACAMHTSRSLQHQLGGSTVPLAEHTLPSCHSRYWPRPAAVNSSMPRHPRCRVQAAAITVQLPNCQPVISFPHLGSGLLFARSTGLKVWPASELLAQVLLGGAPHIWHQVMHVHPSWQNYVQTDTAGTASTTILVEQEQTSQSCQEPSHGICNSSSIPSLEGCVVVELGAGLGLCSIAAGLAGAQVIATDGDADLVRLLKKNIKHNWQVLQRAGETVPQAALLPWGDKQALDKLRQTLAGAVNHSKAMADSQPVVNNTSTMSGDAGQVAPGRNQAVLRSVDMVLLADCVYGSNPGVWEKLVSTLQQLCGPHTLVLQAESRRIEGVLYGEYWDMLHKAGFQNHELHVMQEDLGGSAHVHGNDKDGDGGGVLSSARHANHAAGYVQQGAISGTYQEHVTAALTLDAHVRTHMAPPVRAWVIHL